MAGKSQRTKDPCGSSRCFQPAASRYLVQEGTGAATGAWPYIFSKGQDNLTRQEVRMNGFLIRLPWQLMEVTGHLPLGLAVRQVVSEDK